MNARLKSLKDRTIARLQDLDFCVPPARWTGKEFVIRVEEYDDHEDGEGSRYIGDIAINSRGSFQIDSRVQAAIDRAKRSGRVAR